jgi:hypothetical protein
VRVRVDPLDERGDVDLHLAVRKGCAAVLGDPGRGRVAIALRLLASPLRDWYAAHAVATVATANSTVEPT